MDEKGKSGNPENPESVKNGGNESREEVSVSEKKTEANAKSPFAPREAEGSAAPEDGQEESFSDYVEYFKEWVYKNNPFYLLSVFLMFWGLYLVSVDNTTGRGPDSLKNLVLFYGVQNLYELMMLGMALYLMLRKINLSHGRLLLFFIFLFLVDSTMYQAAIANACGPSDNTMWIGMMVSFFYLILAILKVGLVVYLLKITPRASMIFYAIAAFAIIYFSRQYSSFLITLKTSDVRLFGWWELYVIWLFAALIQIPVILNSWWKPAFTDDVHNEFMGSENHFYTLLLTMPFIALPLQIVLNIHPDLASKNSDLAMKLTYCYVPYLYFGVYFVETIWLKVMREYIGIDINVYDVLAGFFVLFFATVTRPMDISIFGGHFLYPHRLNLILIFGFTLFIALSRKNRMCLAMIFLGAMYYTRTYTFTAFDFVDRFYENFKKASTTTRAIILIVSSFVFLGLGFVFSIAGSTRKKIDTPKQ